MDEEVLLVYYLEDKMEIYKVYCVIGSNLQQSIFKFSFKIPTVRNAFTAPYMNNGVLKTLV